MEPYSLNHPVLILSIADYFRHLDYYRMNLQDRIIHMVFYVTRIAGLRVDMTPTIVTQRLDDIKTYFSQHAVDRNGISNEGTDYEEVKKIMEENGDVFVVLEEIDKRDRHKEDVAYGLSGWKCKELSEELQTIEEYVNKLPDYQAIIKEKDKVINAYKRRTLKRKIAIDVSLLVIVFFAGILCVCWIDKSWNIIGLQLSKLFSEANPIRNNIISGILVNVIFSPYLITRTTRNYKTLNSLRGK